MQFCLCWDLIVFWGPSLLAASRSCLLAAVVVDFSLWWLLLLGNAGCRHTGSVAVAHQLQSPSSIIVVHGLSCSLACEIFPDQGLNPCPLHIDRQIPIQCATRGVPCPAYFYIFSHVSEFECSKKEKFDHATYPVQNPRMISHCSREKVRNLM